MVDCYSSTQVNRAISAIPALSNWDCIAHFAKEGIASMALDIWVLRQFFLAKQSTRIEYRPCHNGYAVSRTSLLVPGGSGKLST